MQQPPARWSPFRRPSRIVPLPIVFALFAAIFVGAMFLVGQTPAQAAPTATIIIVDSAEDLVPTNINHTCTFESGALFFPAADGACTLRRALREAGARPDSDRPITIQFNLPADDEVDGVWELELNSRLLS